MTNFRSIKAALDLAYDHAFTAAIQGDPYHIYTEMLTRQLADAAKELGLKLVPVDEAVGSEDREAA